MLSAAVLVLGVVAGAQLSAARQTQQRMLRSAHTVQSAQDDQRLVAAERQRASAASRAAQREAQAKADAAASVAADQAKVAQQAAPPKAPAKPSASATVKPSTPAPTFGPIPASCSEYTGNVAIGCALMLNAGYGLDQMPCLKNLWMKESGWRETAGRTGGAYGIPQSNPGSKMAVYGADWQTNPATQIKWGLNYIKGRYGSPCGAWSNFRARGSY
jgi:hypothetical protein